MKALKKVMTGVSISALALAVVGGVNAKAENEEQDSTEKPAGVEVKADIYSDTQTLDLSYYADQKEAFVSYDAVNKKGELNAKAKWDTYDVNDKDENAADLSSLKTTKEVNITVQGYEEKEKDWEIYTIPAPDKVKIKGTYKGGTLDLSKSTLPKEAALEWRTATSSYWTPYYAEDTKVTTGKGDNKVEITYPATDFSNFEQQGATLYFRVAAEDFDWEKDTAIGEASHFKAKSGNFASKEFKVKIGKLKNGPSVKIDYVKGLIATKQGQEYRDAAGASFKPADANGISLASADPEGAYISEGTFEIRTAAANGKSASKITVVKLTGRTYAPKVAQATAGTYDVVASPDGSSSSPLKVTVAHNTAGKTDGTVTFDNKSSDVYVVYLKGATKPLATVKAGKTVKVKGTKVTADLEVVVQADKKAGKFQSPKSTLITKAVVDELLKTPATPAPTAK